MTNEVKRSSNIYKRALWRCTVLGGGGGGLLQHSLGMNKSKLFVELLAKSFFFPEETGNESRV